MTALFLLALAVFLWASANGFSRIQGLYQPGEEIRLNAADRACFRKQGGYYDALSARGKARFEHRVVELVYEKDWIGHGMEVTREMKVRIAATLAQLTFGLGGLLLLHFRRVVVHPGAFRNPRTGQEFIGEAAPAAKTLVFSWEHFRQGYAGPGDARNVGLHEAAHALWFANRMPGAETDFLPQRPLVRWNLLAREEIGNIQAGRSRLFRPYAGTNEAEFFAVAVEYFFEQPAAFRERMPELYACLAKLLRQDPASAGAGLMAKAG